MKSAQLCQELGIDRNKLARWLRQGLPSEKDERGHHEFDERAVERWLIEKGLAVDTSAEPPPSVAAAAPHCVNANPIAAPVAATPAPAPGPGDELNPEVKTLVEVARRLNLTYRRVAQLKAEDLHSPLNHGPPYDMDAISEWIAARHLSSATTTSKRAEINEALDEVRLRRALRQAEIEEGLALDRDETLRLVERFHVEALSVFRSVRGEIGADLPATLDPLERANCLARVESRIDQALAILQECARRLETVGSGAAEDSDDEDSDNQQGDPSRD